MTQPNLFPASEPAPRPRKPGHAYRFLVEKQTLLARAKGLSLIGSAGDRGERRYHHLVDTNVHGWDGAALKDYRRGQGNEADGGKIRACHSSSALTCSLFNCHRQDPTPVLRALGLPADPTPVMTLERVLRVLPPEAGGFGGSPNYDCAFEYGDKGLIAAVEVKYSEWASPRPHPPLKRKYQDTSWIWDGLPKLKALAREVTECDPWDYLDAPQLIRHLLGLHLTGRPYRLFYLFVDTFGDEACKHRKEIAEFKDRLDFPDLFQVATVQDLVLKVAQQDYAANAGWVSWMMRYL